MGVYINEDLIRQRSQLLRKARKMVKNKNLLSSWSSDGTILVRDLNDIVHRIQSEHGLVQFGPVLLFTDTGLGQAYHYPTQADVVIPHSASASLMNH